MKQHLTYEQLQKLPIEKIEKLRLWFINTQLGRSEYEENFDQRYGNYPLLSIGQMIEFLNDYLTTNDEDDVDIISKRSYGTWQIDFFHSMRDKSYQSKELCDALWEAVKESLEK